MIPQLACIARQAGIDLWPLFGDYYYTSELLFCSVLPLLIFVARFEGQMIHRRSEIT